MKKSKMFDHRNACFVCTTPYQIIGAISIVKSMKVEADLYIIDIFKDSIKVADKLKKYDLFHDVILIPIDDYKFQSYFKRFSQLLSYKRISSKYISDNCYDTFYFTNDEHILCLIQYALAYRNPNMNYVLYDDGLGTYTQTALIRGWRYRLVEKLLNLNKITKNNLKIMVSFPNLLEKLPITSSLPVEKMHFSSSFFEQNNGMLKEVFSCQNNTNIVERVIFFDRCRGGASYVYNKDLLIKEDKCISILVDYFSYKNVICKSHPRSSFETEVKVKLFKNGTPIELLYMNLPDLKDKVLVGLFSTALFTPKLMFDAEPTVISLHKLLYPEKVEYHSSFVKLQYLYKNPNRLFAPESFDDFIDFISKISNN